MESFKCAPDIDCCKQKHLDMLIERSVLTPKEACNFFSMSARQLRNAIKKNEIQSIKVGKFVRIPTKGLKHLVFCKQETLTINEVSNFLKVSQRTITNLIENKEIDANLFNNKWMIGIEELNKFIK